jgi:Na+/phosphate symporter
VVTEKVELATAPTATEAVGVVITVVPTVAACAGTTDKSPNPRAATATADTFFNEIVFTIFLSFSRSQAFPGPGWWLKRPPH